MASNSARTLIERAKSWFQGTSGTSQEKTDASAHPDTVREGHADVSADDERADADRQRDPAGPTGASSNEFEADSAADTLVDPEDVERASESADNADSDGDDDVAGSGLESTATDRERLDDTVERDDDHADVYPADIRGDSELADRESPDVEGYAGGGQEQIDSN